MEIIRNDVFDLAFRFITETNENIFLTGKAGTGKTTFLKYLRKHATKNIVVTAPTGVAAINAGGVTLHSFFQLPFHPVLPRRQNLQELINKTRFGGQRQQIIRKMDVLVIDEISMVRADVMDAVDALLKHVRRNYNEPFGGVQLLCIGDLFQLPPVAQQHEWSLLSEFYESPFFFDSLAIKEMKPLLLELTEIFRQKEFSFVELLNKVRVNAMDADDLEMLNSRYIPGFHPQSGQKFITLTSHNRQADEINSRELKRLSAPEFSYQSSIEGDFPENALPAEATLILKEGTQVMFLKNDGQAKRYFNGKIGTVSFLDDEKIEVDCDGDIIEVQRETWENSRYTLNKQGLLEQDVLGTFTQYPLRLASAITIHKSQGLTFNHVMLDASLAFSSGQVYVALSRCTSLEGIVLLNKIPQSAIFSSNQVIAGEKDLQHSGSIAEKFMHARVLFSQLLIEEIFGFSEAESLFEKMQVQFSKHINHFTPQLFTGLEQLKILLLNLKRTGDLFMLKSQQLLKEAPVIEENNVLLKRIQDGANWFKIKVDELIAEIKNLPFSTELREVANDADGPLRELLAHLQFILARFVFLKDPFSIAGYLKFKSTYSAPPPRLSIYATSSKILNDEGELMQTLKMWRNMVVEETGLPIYRVANNATLQELVDQLPASHEDLLCISGFGKAKVHRYGDDVLAAINDYREQYNLPSQMIVRTIKKKDKIAPSANKQSPTAQISFELYQAGKSVDEIAATRKLAAATILGHLIPFIAAGNIDIRNFVSIEQEQQILAAVNVHGSLSHKLLMDNTGDDITYSMLKMVLACSQVSENQ